MSDDISMDVDESPGQNTTQNPQSPQNTITVAPPSPHEVVKEGTSSLIVNVFDDRTSNMWNIRQYLSRWPPSITPVLYCNWIALDRGGHNRPVPDLAGLAASFEALKASEAVSVESVDSIAAQHGVLSGKWLIYTDPSHIDRLWAKIVRVVCMELRKGSAKVSPQQEGQSHVICVYVDNYGDEEEVGRVREALRLGAGVKWKIGFKPDVYTHLGIYAKNPWNIRPSRYFS